MKYGFCFLTYFGARIWNTLPPNIKSQESIDVFKIEINKWCLGLVWFGKLYFNSNTIMLTLTGVTSSACSSGYGTCASKTYIHTYRYNSNGGCEAIGKMRSVIVFVGYCRHHKLDGTWVGISNICIYTRRFTYYMDINVRKTLLSGVLKLI